MAPAAASGAFTTRWTRVFPPFLTMFSTRITGNGTLGGGAILIRVAPHRQPFWRTQDPETANPA
jgi:hypothetical protein